MHVVDGVAPMILVVPAEGGEAHADVHPRNLHTGNVAVDVAENGALHDGQVVQIPRAVRVFLKRRMVW